MYITFLIFTILFPNMTNTYPTSKTTIVDPILVEVMTKDFNTITRTHPHNVYRVHKSLKPLTSIAFGEIQKKLLVQEFPPYYPNTFNREFINIALVTGESYEPFVVAVTCTYEGFVTNRNNGKTEIELNVKDSNFILAITEMVENIRAYFNSKKLSKSMEVTIKHPIYKEVLTAGWYQEYGKYQGIGLQKPGGQLVEIFQSEVSNLSANLLEGSNCKARLLLNVWARVNKDLNTISLGIKPYLQAIEFN